MLLHEPGAPDERHLRVRFGLLTPDGRRLEMRFVDQRMFGGLAVSEGGAELPPEIVHIARDPIDPEFDDDEFVRRARRRTSAVKRLLLDYLGVAVGGSQTGSGRVARSASCDWKAVSPSDW